MNLLNMSRGVIVLESFIEWLTNINLASWDALAAIGQLLGAGATFWTARIALRQVNTANKQIEDARQREEEVRKPDLLLTTSIEMDDETENLCIYLTNIKPIPMYILKYYIHRVSIDEEIPYNMFLEGETKIEKMEADSSKTIQHGEVFKIKIPIFRIIDAIEPRKEALSTIHYYTAMDITFNCSIYLKHEFKKDKKENWWSIYFTKYAVSDPERIDRNANQIYTAPVNEILAQKYMETIVNDRLQNQMEDSNK